MADGPGEEQPGSGAGTAEQEPPAAGRRSAERSIRKLDFSQPNKFTTELRRRIGASMSGLCHELADALQDELKCDVLLEVADVEQHTWVAAKSKLPADAIALGVLAADAPQMLLSLEQSWLLQALECLLGGQASQAPAERNLSEIDWSLSEHLLDLMVDELSSAWIDLGGHSLRRGEIDLEGDAGLLTIASEPTLSVTIHSEIDGCEAGMILLLPWPCVEPLAEGLRDGAAHVGGGEAGAQELGRGVADAQVLLRAEVGSVQMPIERMRAIAPGTVLALEQRADEGVRLFAEEVSLGRGRPGASGARRALKLEVADEEPVRSETYASLGRGDLERARAGSPQDGGAASPPPAGQKPMLRSIFVRVWAELGRTHMSLGGALELAPGSVVELDQAAQSPIELFANGLCFANGSLVVSAEGAWAVEVQKLL
jgi:flagellar motor switch protein FliM